MNFKIKGVYLSIQGKLIVNNVSITVNPGEVVGLMGPNGAGKTSTFNLAVGNLKPDKGDVILNNKSIKKLTLPERAILGLGYLTQEPSIFRDLTVKENIDLALQNTFFSSAIIRNRRIRLIMKIKASKLSNIVPLLWATKSVASALAVTVTASLQIMVASWTVSTS